MKITPVSAPIFLPQPPAPRSVGVHASNIIRGIAVDMGMLRPEISDSDEVGISDTRVITDPAAILRMCIGLAWESWYIPEILSSLGVKKHPGEMTLDNIHMTPDGESIDVIITQKSGTGTLRIHEVKATYKSTKTVGDLKEQWMWLSQLKAYCKGAKTTKATIHVLFLCGDYKFPITPQLKCWDIEFTLGEIDSHWELMKDYRNYRESL